MVDVDQQSILTCSAVIYPPRERWNASQSPATSEQISCIDSAQALKYHSERQPAFRLYNWSHIALSSIGLEQALNNLVWGVRLWTADGKE